jgi:D-lyxose ketol-isomerase
MKRSEINKALLAATNFFSRNGWVLPPNPKWDITDFGLGKFDTCGLVLVNLAEEEEYCEKIMYAKKNQSTPSHSHHQKKEDIICRSGILAITLWAKDPYVYEAQGNVNVKLNGLVQDVRSGVQIVLSAGERITIQPGIWHEFHPLSEECMIGEVSTANDDHNDNFFSDQNIGRFSEIVEDEKLLIKLISEQ